MRRCSILLLAALAFVLIAAPADARRGYRCHAEGVTDRFDEMFQRATRRHLPPGFDWCLWKAQAMAESNLRPDAQSPVGAIGIAQILPSTARDVAKRLGRSSAGNLRDAGNSIALGAAYLAYLHRVWSYPRPPWCRFQLAAASYNAGAGRIIAAQKASGGRRCWGHIAAFLPQITGKHAEETLSYINRITANYLRLKGLIQ